VATRETLCSRRLSYSERGAHEFGDGFFCGWLGGVAVACHGGASNAAGAGHRHGALRWSVPVEHRAKVAGGCSIEVGARALHCEAPLSNRSADSSEVELITALAADDPETFERAFQTAYAAHRRVVFGFLLRLAGDSDTASDLFQNVWIKLSRHRQRLRPDTELRAWLCTVARHEYVSYRRAQLVDLSRVLALGREPAHEPTEHDPRLVDVNAALHRLPDADREVLLSTSVDGLSLRQAASVLGISEPALRQRLVRARRRLETALEKVRARERRSWFGTKKEEP
jgi:RNA polymerase sigma-70 factor (ECF subfamily)